MREQVFVAFGPQVRRDGQFHRPRRLGFPQLGGNRLGQRAEIDRLPPQFAPAEARELEQVVNQLVHALGGLAGAAEEVLSLRIKLAGVALQQHLAEPANAAERRAQIVGDGVGEGLQLLVGRLQLRRALLHPPLQLGVQPADFQLRLFCGP